MRRRFKEVRENSLVVELQPGTAADPILQPSIIFCSFTIYLFCVIFNKKKATKSVFLPFMLLFLNTNHLNLNKYKITTLMCVPVSFIFWGGLL